MISLRPIQTANLVTLKEWAAVPEYAEYFRRCPPPFAWPPDAEVEKLFSGWFGIYHEDQLRGVTCLTNWDTLSRKVEFGILITGRNRHPLADSATRQIAAYVFEYLGYEKLYCLILPHRTELRAFCEANGFKFDGVKRRNTFYRGEFHDEVEMSLTKEDYQRVK